jgi:hypothetical protein
MVIALSFASSIRAQSVSTPDLDSAACVLGLKSIQRIGIQHGIRLDSLEILLPANIKRHWQYKDSGHHAQRRIALEELQGKFVPAEGKSTTGVLSIRGTAALLWEVNDSLQVVSFSDSVTLAFDSRMSTDELGLHKYDLVQIEPTQSSGFWGSVLEPALVVIGGAIIVALFFLIRS